jgi:hypothetical protein
MQAFHGSLGTSLLQGIDDPRFENTPVVEGPDPEKIDERIEFFDLVLAMAKLSDFGTQNETQDLTWECR